MMYKMTPTGTLTTLYSFCPPGCPDGVGGGLSLLGTDGNFYGAKLYGPGSCQGKLFKLTEKGTLTTLHCFDGADGRLFKYLVHASSGSFYGITTNGGNLSQCGGTGCGTVFKFTPGKKLTTLYSFCSQTDCTDGAIPFDSLVEGADGDFYGATWGGGLAGGTVFKITPTRTFTTLYRFCIDSAKTAVILSRWC